MGLKCTVAGDVNQDLWVVTLTAPDGKTYVGRSKSMAMAYDFAMANYRDGCPEEVTQ